MAGSGSGVDDENGGGGDSGVDQGVIDGLDPAGLDSRPTNEELLRELRHAQDMSVDEALLRHEQQLAAEEALSGLSFPDTHAGRYAAAAVNAMAAGLPPPQAPLNVPNAHLSSIAANHSPMLPPPPAPVSNAPTPAPGPAAPAVMTRKMKRAAANAARAAGTPNTAATSTGPTGASATAAPVPAPAPPAPSAASKKPAAAKS